MAWICGDAPIVECSDPIIDVQKVIEDWAWNHFMKRTSRFRKMFLKRENFEVDVPMNYYHFEDNEKPSFKEKDAQTENDDADNSGSTSQTIITQSERDKVENSNNTTQIVRSQSTKSHDDPTLVAAELTAKDKDNRDMDSTNPHISRLSTNYVNDTGMAQVYKFRMERTRKATVNISCQKGFSISGEAKFTVGVTEGKIASRYEVTKIRGQTFEQTLLFETSSDINVEERTNCTAMVIFTERETKAKFVVKTKMSLASGPAPIYIRRKKDQKLFALLKLPNLLNAFKPYERKNNLKFIETTYRDDIGDTYRTHAVEFTTEGIIEGVRLSDQTVNLKAVQITEDNAVEMGTLNDELAKHMDFHDGRVFQASFSRDDELQQKSRNR